MSMWDVELDVQSGRNKLTPEEYAQVVLPKKKYLVDGKRIYRKVGGLFFTKKVLVGGFHTLDTWFSDAPEYDQFMLKLAANYAEYRNNGRKITVQRVAQYHDMNIPKDHYLGGE